MEKGAITPISSLFIYSYFMGIYTVSKLVYGHLIGAARVIVVCRDRRKSIVECGLSV